MGRNRLLGMLGALAVGTASVVGVVVALHDSPQRVLNLSTVGPVATTSTTSSDETTETTVVGWMDGLNSPTTTATAPRPVRTTTTAAPVVISAPTTTTALVTTTTVARARAAVVDSVTNHYPLEMSLTIHSINLVSWTIAPGETQPGATFQIGGPTNDGGSSHVVQQPSCGSGDNAQYFEAGHHYVVEVVPNGIADGCGAIPGYFVLLRDVATGETQHII